MRSIIGNRLLGLIFLLLPGLVLFVLVTASSLALQDPNQESGQEPVQQPVHEPVPEEVKEDGVEALARGKEAYLAAKCNLCHSVEAASIADKAKSEKLRGPDLSQVGAERAEEWITAYMLREETLEGKEHKKEFKGSLDELQVIVEWLVALAAEA